MWRNRYVGDTLKRPVEQVAGNPCAAAGAIHVVSAVLTDNGDITGSRPTGAADHGQRIAVARRLANDRVCGKRRSGNGGDSVHAHLRFANGRSLLAN